MFLEFRPTSLALGALISSALLAALPAASAQNQLWVTQLGTSERDEAFDVKPDGGAGGVFVCGATGGSLAGPNAGGNDAFLARYDSAGNQLWIKQFGTSSSESAHALASDGKGGVIIAGETQGDLAAPAQGGYDIFLTHYDRDGNQLWIHQFGSTAHDSVNALEPDGMGGTLLAANSEGSLGGPHAGGVNDAVVARFDSAGNQLWIRQFGTSEKDIVKALAPDGAGGATIGGTTTGSLGGPNAGTFDAFLARYSSAGDQLWIKQFGTNESDGVEALAPDGAGGAHMLAISYGDLGGPHAGGADMVLARHDSMGDQIWIEQFGTSEHEFAGDLILDSAGGVIVTGYTKGDFGGPNAGDWDVFLSHHDALGQQLWVQQFGTVQRDQAFSLGAGGAGSVFVAGLTRGDLGGPNPAPGTNDAWLARFTIDNCYADCDQSTGNGVLDVFDFLCFQNSFVNAEPYACDCDTSTGNGVCDVFDFLCFQNAFVGGCP